MAFFMRKNKMEIYKNTLIKIKVMKKDVVMTVGSFYKKGLSLLKENPKNNIRRDLILKGS